MALASAGYEARSPGTTVLYQIVRDHLETFRAQAAQIRDGQGLPAFVERAFRDFLQCGWLAGGFARFRCRACGLDRLVAFSCKGRTLCPSCGGRRMAERSAHLVDRVRPDVPVRQWVLSLPYRLRYLLAWDHDLCRAVAAVLARAVFRRLRDRACDAGIPNGHAGGVVVIQRFGGALNLNLHFHALVLDGVFAAGDTGLRFHPLGDLTTLDVEEVLATIEPLVARRLRRRGLLGDGDDPPTGWAEDAPVLAEFAAASIEGRGALGGSRGLPLTRMGRVPAWADPPPPGRCHARSNGFSLHAALVIPAGQRDRLERVCRYVLRPPVAVDRLELMSGDRVRLSLREPWRDGTSAFVFEPVDFLGRLAVLVPRPRINLILYYGVLGARAGRRPEIVRRAGGDVSLVAPSGAGEGAHGEGDAERRTEGRSWRWAALMRRTFGFDVLACPRCQGRLRLIALIEDAAVVGRILRHLGLPDTIPLPRPARAPPATVLDGVDELTLS